MEEENRSKLKHEARKVFRFASTSVITFVIAFLFIHYVLCIIQITNIYHLLVKQIQVYKPIGPFPEDEKINLNICAHIVSNPASSWISSPSHFFSYSYHQQIFIFIHKLTKPKIYFSTPPTVMVFLPSHQHTISATALYRLDPSATI